MYEFNQEMKSSEKIKNAFKQEWCYLKENMSLYFHTAASVTSAILGRMKQTAGIMALQSGLNVMLTSLSIATMTTEAIAALTKGRYIQGALLYSLIYSQMINLATAEMAKWNAEQLKAETNAMTSYMEQYSI